MTEARSRVRDEGHVFHVEGFVVPVEGYDPTLEDLVRAREKAIGLDWKIDDMVVVPVEQLPGQMLPEVREQRSPRHDAGR